MLISVDSPSFTEDDIRECYLELLLILAKEGKQLELMDLDQALFLLYREGWSSGHFTASLSHAFEKMTNEKTSKKDQA